MNGNYEKVLKTGDHCIKILISSRSPLTNKEFAEKMRKKGKKVIISEVPD